MKKICLLIAISILMPAALLAAGQIVCTTYPLWLLTREITLGVPGNNVVMLVPFDSGCAHEYTPSLRDLKQVAAAGTLLVCHGSALDNHLKQAALKVNKNLSVAQVDRLQPGQDQHTFASPDTAVQLVREIATALSKYDPDNQKIYQHRSDIIVADLDKIARQIRQQSQLRHLTVIIQAPLFSNLLKLTGWEVIMLKKEKSAIPSPAELRKVLQRSRSCHAAAVIAEKNHHDRTVAAAAAENKLPITELDMLISGPENPPAGYYQQTMRENCEKLRKISNL